MRLIKKGSTDVTDYVFIQDSGDGSPETGVTVTGLDTQYVRNRATPSAKQDASDLGSVDAAHSDNGIYEVDGTDQPGLYRVDWPDAAFAAGVGQVVCTVQGTGFQPAHKEYQLVDFDPEALLTDIAAENRAEMDSNSTQLAAILDDTDLIDDGTSGLAKIASDVADVLVDTNEVQGKLPTTKFMGSSDGADDDATLNTINTATARLTAVRAAVLTDLIDGGRLDALLDSIVSLLDDARTEPGQGDPPVNPDAMTKLDYLYKTWRNKKNNDGSTTNLYDDAGTTIDQKQTTSESGGTVTKAEWESGA